MGPAYHSLAIQNEVDVLSYITTMEIIMVLHRPLILVVNLGDELQKLVKVNDLEDVILLQEGCSDEWHLHVSANCLRKFEDVEVKAVYLIIESTVLLDHLFDVDALQVEINAIRVDLDRPEVVVPLESFFLSLT